MGATCFAEAFGEAIAPRERVPVYEWAESHVTIPHSARSSRFDRTTAPWLNAPMDAARDNRNREICILAPVGSGKSTFFEVLSCYIVGNDPGPTLAIMQTDADAKDWAETRLHQVFASCGPVTALYPGDRHKKRKLEVIFPHMPYFIGGASINNLQAKSIRWCLGDELWTWKRGLLGEFRRRTHERWNARVILVSQGGNDGDDWAEATAAGEWHEWMWACPACGHRQPYRWGRVKYDDPEKGEDGEPDWARVEASARMECEAEGCGAVVRDDVASRRALSAAARYERTRSGGESGHVTYHFPVMAVWWVPWGRMAVEWLKAQDAKRRGDTNPLRQFIQKRLAEHWLDEEAAPHAKLQGAGYCKADFAEGQPWEGEALRFMTVDKQRDHFWYVIRAWRADGSSRLISEGKLLTFEMVEQARGRHKVKPRLTFIDAQYDTHNVYMHCHRFDWTAIHGSQESGFRHYPRKGINAKPVTRFYSKIETASLGGGVSARYVFFSAEKCKDALALLRSGQGVPWEIPDDASDDYHAQIDSEVKREVVAKVTKAVSLRWCRISGRQNHLWDCEVQQVAAAMMMRVLSSRDDYLPPSPTSPAPGDG